jgi:hypothetical protein
MYQTTSDDRKMEMPKLDQEAVKRVLDVTDMWVRMTAFEQDLENYEKLRQEYAAD